MEREKKKLAQESRLNKKEKELRSQGSGMLKASLWYVEKVR